MAHKRKKKRQKIDQDDVLKQNVAVTALELIKMIHRINPTGKKISSKQESERYKIKAQLQSLLIRRFHDGLRVTQPDPENPRLVALNLRHFDEDACHALVDELDEDARAWTQRQIDEALTDVIIESTESSGKSIHYHKPSSAAQYSQRSNEKEIEEDLSKDELINLGQNALTEYDYDACEAYYRRALKLSPDDLDPVLSLLELFVDHLAAYEKAMDLSNSISTSVKKNEKVKTLLALAAARCGRIDRALEYIKRAADPGVSEVYLISANHFMQQGDIDAASKLLSVLKSFEQAELEPEIEKLERNIQSLQAKSLEPIEQEMILAWQQGRTKASLNLADRLLSVSPENKAARRIQHKFEKQQRDERIDRLLRKADDAKKNNDFSREAELLNKAIELGGNARKLAKRLKYAQNQAKRKKEGTEIQDTINLWTEGNKKRALLRYIDLNAQQQSHIINNIYDPHFAWIDRILSTQTTAKPEKLVEAVLVLGKSKEALQKKKEPERIIAEMKAHSKVLQSVPEAHNILQQAETMSNTIKHKKSKDFLDNAAGFLETENLQEAGDFIDRVKVGHLKEKDKKRFEEINQRLHHLERLRRLEQSYTDSHIRGDHFAAREIAGELAKLAGQDTSGHWFDRLAEHSSVIQKEWSLATVDINELPACYACFGLTYLTEDINCCLLPDGHHLVIATSHERWVFVRTFCLDDQKFKKAILLRAPKQISLHNICPVGNGLWITGQDGNVLELGLEPPNILSWYDFSDIVNEKVVEGAWLFPKSKSLWLNKRDAKSDFEDIFDIINIETQRVIRQVKSVGYPIVINTGGQFRAAVQHTITKAVQVYSERGKPVENFVFEDYQTVNAAALHPNGKDFVLLPFDDSGTMNPFSEFDMEPQGDLIIHIEVRPDLKRKYQPVRLENTNGELHHFIFTSLDTGIIFIFFADDSTEDSAYKLAAFKEDEQGFDLLYQVSAPGKFTFACDEFSRRVAAITFESSRLQAVVLNDNPPVLEFENGNPFRKVIPEFDPHHFLCNTPTGEYNATSLTYTMQIRNCSGIELFETIHQMKQPGFHNPDEIAAFIYALYRSLHMEESQDLKKWMRTQYPDHYSVLLDLAEEAAREKNWEEVISLLERISRADLDDGTARHICHLLGMGYFIKNEIKKALNIWREGETYENGKCDFDPYIEYARLSLMSAKKRQKQKSDIVKKLNEFESVDNHLANKRYSDAVETIEKTEAMSKDDLQMLARLTWAYLCQDFPRGDMQWLCKVIALANYCECYNDEYLRENIVLPPYIETWPESRLDDIAIRAEKWLEDFTFNINLS